jgi:hypothetical protein
MLLSRLRALTRWRRRRKRAEFESMMVVRNHLTMICRRDYVLEEATCVAGSEAKVSRRAWAVLAGQM